MDTGSPFAALLGAGTGLGLVLIRSGLRPAQRSADPGRWPRLLTRACATVNRPRLAVTVLTAALVAALTRWPAGTALAGLAGWFLPAMLSPDHNHAKALARIEAIASWSESLRDTLAAAAGLEQAILATAPLTSGAIREHVTGLAARIRQGQPLPAALRAFADEAADPIADLIVAALLVAAEQQASDLGQLLGSLADSARQHAQMRMRIAASRARVRTASRIITAVTVLLTAGLLVWSRGFLSPYGTAAGQLVLAAVGGCFTVAFWWLARISRFGETPRILARPGGLPAANDGTPR